MKILFALPRMLRNASLPILLLGGGALADESDPAALANTNAPVREAPDQELVEKLQREIELQVTRQTEAITASLTQIGPALNRLQLQQAAATQSADRTLLLAAGLFAVAGFLGLGFLTMTSLRAMVRFSELALASSASPRRQLPAPGETSTPVVEASSQTGMSGSAERASARFQGALEQLEKRILELEHSSHPPVASADRAVFSEVAPSGASALPADLQPLPDPPASGSSNGGLPALSRTEMLMGKGQALLSLGQALAALECFTAVLEEEPENTAALTKQGMAFEKLEEWEQALQSYDRALALDSSLTLAHLHKGGVCNQLQRHREALECFEQALRSEPKQAAP